MDDVGDRIVEAGLARLATLTAERDRLDGEILTLQGEIQGACEHPEKEIVEGEYRKSYGGGAEPPFRVCRCCGYSELGWNCGYFRLAPDNTSLSPSPIPVIAREEAWKFIRGGLMSQSEKDKLFRAKWNKELARRVSEERAEAFEPG
jgi:hypothetical protein